MGTENLSSNPDRIQSLDGIRFIMCLGIAFYHFTPYFFPPADSGFDPVQKFAYFTDVFFVISGFFLARSNRDLRLVRSEAVRFFGLRVARIYPLHLACLAFYLAIAVAAHSGIVHPENPERYDFSQLLPNMLLIHAWGGATSFSFNYVTWSLSALWLMYLLYPGIAHLARRSVAALALLVALTLFAGEWLTNDLCREALTLAQDCDFGILRAIPSFLFGVLLAHLGTKWVGRRAAFIGLSVLAGTVLATPMLEGWARLLLVYSLLFFFLAADAAGLRTPLAWPPLTRLARYSFGIFLIHPLVATILFTLIYSRVIEHPFVQAVPYWLVVTAWLAAGLVATVIAAVASFKILEKPAERVLAGRLAGSKPKGSAWR
jgi:peptidoglycan/LPS O-acetylase OafA/YrhL